MTVRPPVAALLAAVFLCAGGAASAQDINVATVGPMTGQYAVFGEQLRRGAALAVEDINARGGVLGRKLKLEVGDDACDPKQAVAVAHQLAARKMALIAGHYCSSSSIPASAVYFESNVLQISPASSAPAFTDDAVRKKWRNVFRTYGRDDAQGLFAGRYLAERFKGRSVAVIHDKSAYGKGLADETRNAMARGGLKEAMYEAINQGEKDFSALVTKMKRGRVDAIYFGGYHTEAGLLVRQAREQGMTAVMISGDAIVTDEYWKIAGKAAEGTLMTFAPDPRLDPAAKDIVARFKAQGYDPEGYTLYTYAAFQVWAAAVEKFRSLRTGDVSTALRMDVFDTVIGRIDFDDKGDVIDPKYVLYVWKDGKYAVIP